MIRRLSALLFAFTLLAGAAVAQDEEERPALPDIAPRTVEIRGQLEIHFPALERQPLVGFNPPPRMVDMSERRPFMEEYRQGAADLPPSPLQEPTSPVLARLAGIERRTGQLEARAGRYFARHVDARVEHSIRPEMAVSGRLRYRGLDGHRPYDFDPEANSASDDIQGRADLHFFGPAVRGGVGIDGFHTSYEMFGATSSFTSPPLNPYPARTGQHLGASAWLRTADAGAVDAGMRLNLSGTSFETDACPDESSSCLTDRFSRDQRSLALNGDAEVQVGRQTLFARGSLSMSGLDTGALVGADVMTGDLAAGAVLFRSRNLALRGAARFLYASSNGAAEQADYTLLYVSPDVRLDVYPGAGVQLFAENRPSATHPSLAAIHRENPYVVSQPSLQAELRPVDARAGVRLFRGPATLDVQGGLVLAPEYRYYAHASRDDGYATGTSRVLYDDARIIHVGGEVSMIIGGGANANAGLTWRSGRLTDQDADIPNFSPLVGHAMVSVPLASNRFLLSAGGRYESARHRDIAQSREIGDYVAMDVRGTYRLNHMIGIVGSVENISAGYLERWDGYPQPPLIISGGMRLSW